VKNNVVTAVSTYLFVDSMTITDEPLNMCVSTPTRLTVLMCRSHDSGEKIEIIFRRWRLWQQEIQMRLWWRLRRGLAEYVFGGSLASVAVKMFSHLT
jgi:hypothetical protein